MMECLTAGPGFVDCNHDSALYSQNNIGDNEKGICHSSFKEALVMIKSILIMFVETCYEP